MCFIATCQILSAKWMFERLLKRSFCPSTSRFKRDCSFDMPWLVFTCALHIQCRLKADLFVRSIGALSLIPRDLEPDAFSKLEIKECRRIQFISPRRGRRLFAFRVNLQEKSRPAIYSSKLIRQEIIDARKRDNLSISKTRKFTVQFM